VKIFKPFLPFVSFCQSINETRSNRRTRAAIVGGAKTKAPAVPGLRSSSLAQRRALPKLRSQNHVRAGIFSAIFWASVLLAVFGAIIIALLQIVSLSH
jgi:hypothetical protein